MILNPVVAEALVLRATAVASWECAAASFSSSSAAWKAPQTPTVDRKQGDLPRRPTLPQRSLLLRKLVEYQRVFQPAVEQDAATRVGSTKLLARAARTAAAQQYLAAVQAAAARQDIETLLQQLTDAAAASHASHDLTTTAAETATSSSSLIGDVPGKLVATAAALAARQLAAASDRPDHAQAFVEMVADRGLLQPQQLQRAVHAVLQAYANKGDHQGVLAAATRFYDIGSSNSSSLLPPGTRPSSCTLALLLNSAASTHDADLVMGAWRYLGSSTQQQQQQQLVDDDLLLNSQSPVGSADFKSSSSNNYNSQLPQPGSCNGRRRKQQCLSARGVLPEQNVLHALVFGSIMCDLAGSGAIAGSSRAHSNYFGFTAGPVVAAAAAAATAGNAAAVSGARSVSDIIFNQDSTTAEALRELQASLMQYQQQEVQQQQQQRWRRRHRQQRLQLPVALLHPNQAAALLQLTTSAADTDILLLSQLYQPTGLTIDDAIHLTQQQQHKHLAPQPAHPGQLSALGSTSWLGSTAGSTSVNPDVASLSSQHPLALLNFQIKPEVVPMFPPLLRSDVARAAVAAYARHGDLARAAAVAHAAAVANPKDGQQYQLLIRSCAAAGKVMPALVTMTKMRERLWQTAAPRAQAAVLRCLSRSGASPPLGAAPSSQRLLSFFDKYCTPHPKTWAALLHGLVITGDRGARLFKTLRKAMAEPYSYMAMAGFSAQQLDKARSVIVADLLRGILAARPGSSRLEAVLERAAAATAAVGTTTTTTSGSSSSSSKQQARLSRTLTVPAYGSGRNLIISDLWQQQQQQPQQLDDPADARSAQRMPLLLPGLPLERQSVHGRRQVLLVLSMFNVLEAWGVTLQHDAALAAALQVLRFCADTNDARDTGILLAVLQAALAVGIRPAAASLKALLSCCADLESRPGKAPLGLTTGAGMELQGDGRINLAQVLKACEDAVRDLSIVQPGSSLHCGPALGLPVGPACSSSSTDSSVGGQASDLKYRIAADFLRTWAFHNTFACVEQVMTNGPAWQFSRTAQPTAAVMCQAGGSQC